MQVLHNQTNLQSGEKRTRAMDAMNSAADYLSVGKPIKRRRSSDDHHVQQHASANAKTRQQSGGLVTHPGIGSKAQLHMQHLMPSPAVLNMCQPFLRQLAAGIAAGFAAGADSNNKDGTRATGADAAAAASIPELRLPVLQEAGIDIMAFFQPMVQTMMMMTAGAHSASIQDSKTVMAASRGIPMGVQGNTAGTSEAAVAGRTGNRGRGQSARSVASKSAIAKAPTFNPAGQAEAEAIDQAAVVPATAAKAAANCEAVEAIEELQLQNRFVSPAHHIPASPEVQQQQQQQPQPLPSGTWMSSSSSSTISSSWAGPAAEIRSPTTSITGVPPRPASTSSKQQQLQQQQGLLSPAGLQLTSSSNGPWAASPSPSCSAIAASAGGSAAAAAGSTAAVGGVRIAPGPEDSQAINMHRQRILLLERQLGNMHPEVGQAYLTLAQALTQEGSMWSLAMSERAHQRAAQILESLRQRTATSNPALIEATAAVTAPAAAGAAAAATTVPREPPSGAAAVLDTADAYVYVTANQQANGIAAKL